MQSSETYVGYRQAERFASPERLAQDSRKTYSPPPTPSLNQWGLSGSWNVGVESAVLQAAPGKIMFRFHARDLHMVLGPTKNGKAVRFKVTLDGTAPGDDRGTDSAPDGTGEVREPHLYQLIRQKGQVNDRTFEIEFLDPDCKSLRTERGITVNHTSMMLTSAMLFALLPTVLGHSESARAQGNSADAKRPESPFACNRLALTAEQRKRHFDELGPTLRSLKKGVRELPNGYEFEFPADPKTVQLVAEWAVGERACCPFFDIDMRLEREGGSLWLGLTGREGVKQFIQADGAAWIRR